MSLPRVRPLGDFLVCLFGPAVWAAHLFVVYGTEALACTPGVMSPRRAVLLITIATIVALAALAAFVALQYRANRGRLREEFAFLQQISIALALLAAVAVLWGAAPASLLPPCLPAAG